MAKINNQEKSRIVAFSSFAWFVAGFDLISFPFMATQIGILFFPSENPIDTILAVYGTLSLSLLARVFGGIFFGRLGDKHKRISVIRATLWMLTFFMFISAFIPSVRNGNSDMILFAPLLLILTRVAIGFSVGGLWPTAAVFAMERLSGEKIEDDDAFQKNTKKKTFWSAFLQAGFHAGYLVAAVIIILWPNVYEGSIYFHATLQWRTLCILGFFIGLTMSIISLFQKEPQPKIETSIVSFEKENEGSIRELIFNKRYRDTLFNFWLILTGLMYMYYSTVVISPDLIKRNISDNPYTTLGLLLMTLLAHIVLGPICLIIWNKKEWFNGYVKRIYSHFPRRLRGILGSYEPRRIVENIDIVMILAVGLAIIPIAIFGIWYFQLFYKDSLDNPFFANATVVYISLVILFCNSGWAVIPSLITSRFPRKFRNIGASLAYNGGLVIGFASPFINMEFFLLYNQEYLLFLPMILGAIAMVIGAIRFINSFLYKTYDDLQGMKIKYPSTWQTRNSSEIPHLNSIFDVMIMPNSNNSQIDSSDICAYLSRRDGNENMTTKKFLDIIKQAPYPISTLDIKILQSSVINLSGNATNRIICSFNGDDYYLHGYWTQRYHITYIIIFRIKADKHRNYLPTIEKMINSLELEPNITLKASS